MQYAAIIGGCILASVCYGIVHDQITARVCVEYFTVAHPPLYIDGMQISSPTALGFAWGVIATWWVGAFLGVMLAAAARSGKHARISFIALIRPVCILLCVMAGLAALASGTGYLLANSGLIHLRGTLGSQIPPSHHAAFLADAFAHNMSYATGFVGGIAVCIRTWRRREAASLSRSETA